MKTTLPGLLVALAWIAGVHPALAQLTLGIAPAGNQSVLFWPSNATSYVLQDTTNLVSTNWVWANDAVPAAYGSYTAVTITNTPPARFFRLIQIPTVTADGMALIPAGGFTMGNSIGDADITNAATVNANLSPFYMDTNLVSSNQWQAVYNWATNHGYGFVNAGLSKTANNPVQTVDWYDCVKWCNARSQEAGLTPVYYTDAGLTQVFTNGEMTPYVNWLASGYRLPMEAEWEKAARGGLAGQRFQCGDTISESQANYYGYTAYSYDLGPNGDNAIGLIGGLPYTSPVGSFAPNGYGLFDMAGNVMEWCWDWYGTPYAGGSDPRGPASGSERVMRGGYWTAYATLARCASRLNVNPSLAYVYFGLRCVRGI